MPRGGGDSFGVGQKATRLATSRSSGASYYSTSPGGRARRANRKGVHNLTISGRKRKKKKK